MSTDALRDGVGMVLAVKGRDWAGYHELASRYALDDEPTRLLVNQLAALGAILLPEDDVDGFARHMAGRGGR